MEQLLAKTEDRIQLTLQAYKSQENAKLVKICKIFNVSRGALRSRLQGHQPPSIVRGLHNRALSPGQKDAIRRYVKSLMAIDCALRFSII